jgi:hypothetical protein
MGKRAGGWVHAFSHRPHRAFPYSPPTLSVLVHVTVELGGEAESCNRQQSNQYNIQTLNLQVHKADNLSDKRNSNSDLIPPNHGACIPAIARVRLAES